MAHKSPQSTSASSQDQSFVLSNYCKGPSSPLIKAPYILVGLLEGKDVYITNGTNHQLCDPYATVSFGNSHTFKTETIQRTSNPRWNRMFEFDFEDTDAQEGLLIISVYDSDPLGTDELIANQIIPMSFFTNKGRIGYEEELWIQLNDLSIEDNEDGHYVIETSENILSELQFPQFEESIIDKENSKFMNSCLPKLHLTIEIIDHQAIFNLNCHIIEVRQSPDNDKLNLKYFIYVLLIQRNDGLEWIVHRRYSEIWALRKKLLSAFPDEITAIPFPQKNMLKFASFFSTSKADEYKKNSLERCTMLSGFLQSIVHSPKFYSDPQFIDFFTSNQPN